MTIFASLHQFLCKNFLLLTSVFTMHFHHVFPWSLMKSPRIAHSKESIYLNFFPPAHVNFQFYCQSISWLTFSPPASPSSFWTIFHCIFLLVSFAMWVRKSLSRRQDKFSSWVKKWFIIRSATWLSYNLSRICSFAKSLSCDLFQKSYKRARGV